MTLKSRSPALHTLHISRRSWILQLLIAATLVFVYCRMKETSRLRRFVASLGVASMFESTTVLSQSCLSYTVYSQQAHGNRSTGPLGLPFMRPDPSCRTFESSAVETVIWDMKARLKDPDLARLFENTFPNTLDTTVKYFNSSENVAFIITGDITAQWLRDTANQFAHYYRLLPYDGHLATLVKAVINTEARYVSQYPYCGAFQPPPESGLSPTVNDWAIGVVVNPPVDNRTVFECKYEIDSLCGFLKLSRSYYLETKDSSFMNDNWYAAINQIFRVIEEQSQASWDENYTFISFYNWTGTPGLSLSPSVNNAGNNEPKGYTGLVGTHHRPSDDLSTFAFLTPANAMLSVELGYLASILQATNQGSSNISKLATQWSSRIEKAIWDTTLVNNVFAYETNGLGSRYVMDDANGSLLSLPYLGFLQRGNEAYKATREVLLSRQNPYYAEGKTFGGIGGPHTNAWRVWPMSLISSIYGTDDDGDILESLYMIANNTAGLGLIHESQNIHNSSDFTRTWFAWANSFFAEMLLDLAQRKPYLIFQNNESYSYGQQV